jgi:hypothetical protein
MNGIIFCADITGEIGADTECFAATTVTVLHVNVLLQSILNMVIHNEFSP